MTQVYHFCIQHPKTLSQHTIPTIHVDCGTVHKSQESGPALMSINNGINKGNVVRIHNVILWCHKNMKSWHVAKIEATGNHYLNGSIWYRKAQIKYFLSYTAPRVKAAHIHTYTCISVYFYVYTCWGRSKSYKGHHEREKKKS